MFFIYFSLCILPVYYSNLWVRLGSCSLRYCLSFSFCFLYARKDFYDTAIDRVCFRLIIKEFYNTYYLWRSLSLTRLDNTIGMISNNDIVLLQICFSLKFFSFLQTILYLKCYVKLKLGVPQKSWTLEKGSATKKRFRSTVLNYVINYK